MFLLLALFCSIGIVLLICIARRAFAIGLILIIFLFSSTESFYRLFFVEKIALDKTGTHECAVAVTDGSDVVETAALISSIRSLRIARAYVIQTAPNPALHQQLDQFFMKSQDLRYLHTDAIVNDGIKNVFMCTRRICIVQLLVKI